MDAKPTMITCREAASEICKFAAKGATKEASKRVSGAFGAVICISVPPSSEAKMPPKRQAYIPNNAAKGINSAPKGLYTIMPYPMESGMEIMAADIAPERSPLIFDNNFVLFIRRNVFIRSFLA
jgi:hypothetical protein